MKIDAHHHFWIYDPAQYGWIGQEALRRNFLPADLQAEIADAGVDGVVSVQARQTLEETRWLLEFAARHAFIRGVVGWVPLSAPDLRDELARLASQPKLKAVRHVLQGERDDQYVARPDFNAGVAALREFNLAYDILIYERHLPQTVGFVDRHPRQTFVVDHIAKPRIREKVVSPWREQIRELARRPNVYCKLSGLVTEADARAWTPEQLRPYAETVLEAFGPRRVMFGSDWPVCLAACTYRRWHDVAAEFLSRLSATEQARVWGGTATEAYRL
jgi:L-fuconolactonase